MTIREYDTPNKIYSEIRYESKRGPALWVLKSNLQKKYSIKEIERVIEELVNKKEVYIEAKGRGYRHQSKKYHIYLTPKNREDNYFSAPGFTENAYQSIKIKGMTGISVENIKAIVSSVTGISAKNMEHKSRQREFVVARQLAMYFSKHFTDSSLKTIGRFFGGRDHSTVIHAVTQMDNLYATDKRHKELMNKLFKIIESKDNECRNESNFQD